MPRSDALVLQLDGLLTQPPSGGDTVVPTGFDQLDELLHGGLRAGQLTLVGGVTGVGASIFALGLARRAALEEGIATYYLAPDSSTREIHARIIAAEARVPLGHLRAGALDASERERVAEQRSRLEEADLQVNAGWAGPMGADVMADSVDRLAGDGCGLVVVDDTGAAEPSRRELLRSLRRTAQAHRTAIVLVSTFVVPRDRASEPPRLEDLRDYASTADLLDLVLSLHRPELHDHACPRPGEADVEVLKHRYGTVQLARIAFQGHYARFVDVKL